MARPAQPEKFCPMCSLLHTRWGETCRERLMSEVRDLRERLAVLGPPAPAPSSSTAPLATPDVLTAAHALLAALREPRMSKRLDLRTDLASGALDLALLRAADSAPSPARTTTGAPAATPKGGKGNE